MKMVSPKTCTIVKRTYRMCGHTTPSQIHEFCNQHDPKIYKPPRESFNISIKRIARSMTNPISKKGGSAASNDCTQDVNHWETVIDICPDCAEKFTATDEERERYQRHHVVEECVGRANEGDKAEPADLGPSPQPDIRQGRPSPATAFAAPRPVRPINANHILRNPSAQVLPGDMNTDADMQPPSPDPQGRDPSVEAQRSASERHPPWRRAETLPVQPLIRRKAVRLRSSQVPHRLRRDHTFHVDHPSEVPFHPGPLDDKSLSSGIDFG
ncbi:hypothetical protein B0O99DRAFT_597622 [Bisporella sp. PMI_857]|nr:hypothetical protein B0O99DRAFT_597622 [Bisporella sp. PMI_857]